MVAATIGHGNLFAGSIAAAKMAAGRRLHMNAASTPQLPLIHSSPLLYRTLTASGPVSKLFRMYRNHEAGRDIKSLHTVPDFTRCSEPLPRRQRHPHLSVPEHVLEHVQNIHFFTPAFSPSARGSISHERSPRMLRSSWMSLRIRVTRYAWMAQRLAPSNRSITYDSAASCSARTSVDWMRRSG